MKEETYMKFKNFIVLVVLPLFIVSAVAAGTDKTEIVNKKLNKGNIVGAISGNGDVNNLLRNFYKSDNYKDLMKHSRNLIQEDCDGLRNACSEDSMLNLKNNLVNSIFSGSEKSLQGEGGWNFEGRIQKQDMTVIQSIVTDFLLLNIEKIDGHTEDAIEAIFEKLRNDLR